MKTHKDMNIKLIEVNIIDLHGIVIIDGVIIGPLALIEKNNSDKSNARIMPIFMINPLLSEPWHSFENHLCSCHECESKKTTTDLLRETIIEVGYEIIGSIISDINMSQIILKKASSKEIHIKKWNRIIDAIDLAILEQKPIWATEMLLSDFNITKKDIIKEAEKIQKQLAQNFLNNFSKKDLEKYKI
ncbi:hypothetical protein CL633_03000 [bacterium]|nr:hypothetical protein [bacterium]|tara:strand:+ start:3652 stop:4215 length:564 start_codon:yes stop_codon:yes gene_type:complete